MQANCARYGKGYPCPASSLQGKPQLVSDQLKKKEKGDLATKLEKVKDRSEGELFIFDGPKGDKQTEI